MEISLSFRTIDDLLMAADEHQIEGYEHLIQQVEGFAHEFNEDTLWRTNDSSVLSCVASCPVANCRCRSGNVGHPRVFCRKDNRLTGLHEFAIARNLIPLVLTARDPFDCELFSSISADLQTYVLRTLTGLGPKRSVALFRSLRSNLDSFSIRRIAHCSIYKAQALFVERFRQALFDEKHKGLQREGLAENVARAFRNEPENLEEFQQQRKQRLNTRREINARKG